MDTEHILIAARITDMKNVFILLVGILIGLTLSSFFDNKPDNDYYESYVIALDTKQKLQENFMEFYTTEYCDENFVKKMYAKTFGVTFEAIYCEKSNIMLLDDDLPIHILKIQNDTKG